ncbi:hypothetical protein LEMLEM_LOCUS16592 [Lemmus lemmus]
MWIGDTEMNNLHWTFHDNEMHLLLAATVTSRGRWASKRLLSHLGKKLLLPGLLRWTCMTCREMTADLA